jgi:hypothetical protein
MNGPEILRLIRHDLERAVAERGEPPTPQPMDASPWVAMSAMQKATRRGREDLALSAAATVVRDAPDKLWRRVACIAYEDIGVASLETVGLATVALAGKRHRSARSGEWAVASCVVSELWAADDLLMACELHPAYTEARRELSHRATRDLITVATGRGAVHERALTLWYALGTERDRSKALTRMPRLTLRPRPPLGREEAASAISRSRTSHGPGRNCRSPRMWRRGLSGLRSSLSSSLTAQTGHMRGTKPSRRCCLSHCQARTVEKPGT